ncbi:hypothetical protein Smp_047500 [Schistosoma mansoni]|uniref:hypothetical protein n=1 Tax=Schistosoma mansoni TaxID=6183 RepID=UPI0001A641F1|nr:hypothetical protein Smp_047500 [Schistosoma mansoni]|eukprot:XP_018649878.1 hypothetical protein Smp_047500 [Schistosoma mansoni]
MPPCSNIVDLPLQLVEQVFKYLSYEEVSKLRETCRFFDVVCRGILNKGFKTIERMVVSFHSELRSQLPRRESERRNHLLNRHCETLSAIETRLSLLKMSIMRYADKDRCCFFPGKVLDEMQGVCRFIRLNQGVPIRPYDILHELRDISSMAMEHFEENILPSLHLKSNLGNSWLSSELSSPSISQARGPIPLDELRAVSTFKRQQLNQLAQHSYQLANMENVTRQESGTVSKELTVNHKLTSDVKRLKQGQALNMARICKLSRMVYYLLCKQREVTEQNKQLGSLVKMQSRRIKQLEAICGTNSVNCSDGLESTSSSSPSSAVCTSSSPSHCNQLSTTFSEQNILKSGNKRVKSKW